MRNGNRQYNSPLNSRSVGMPKRLIKHYMPDQETLRKHRHLKVFGTLHHNPNLWHLNRRSASGAFAVGLFMAFVPVPFQMLLAAGGAILARVNLPLSVLLVWITNPVTMPPIFFGAYRLGTWLMGARERDVNFSLSPDWLVYEMGVIWQPFLLGCFILGTLSAAVGFGIIRGLWRLRLVRHHHHRKQDRAARETTR